MKNKYFRKQLDWYKTEDLEFPYETDFEGDSLKIRLNNFPDEHLYTLFVNEKESGDFDDWIENWTKTGRRFSGRTMVEAQKG